MKAKDMIMFGIIFGVAFLFLGAMITSSFESDEENLVPYKVSSFIKIIGVGIITTTFLIGGITANDINKHFKITLLIIGLVLLIGFTIAAQFMKWDVTTANIEQYYDGFSGSISSSASSSGDAMQVAYETKPNTPGFELIIFAFALIAAIIIKKVRKVG